MNWETISRIGCSNICKTGAMFKPLIIKLLVLIFAFSNSTIVKSQADTSYRPSFNFRLDNDYLNISLRGTDRYYSDGLFLGFSSRASRLNPMDRLMVISSKSAFRIRTFSASHQIYTPHHIGNPNLQVGDYPYVGLFTMNYSNLTLESNYSIASELRLGMQGPVTHAEQLQKYIHRKIFHSNYPLGWQYQLPNDIAMCYTIRYTQRVWRQHHIEVASMAEVTMGTLYDNMKLGGVLTIGKSPGLFTPQQYIFGKRKTFRGSHIYMTLSPYMQLVQSNSLLEGGPFKSAGGMWGTSTAKYYHIDRSQLERFMYGYSWQLRYMCRAIALSYTQQFHSAEIKGQNGHVYGSVDIQVRL